MESLAAYFEALDLGRQRPRASAATAAGGADSAPEPEAAGIPAATVSEPEAPLEGEPEPSPEPETRRPLGLEWDPHWKPHRGEVAFLVQCPRPMAPKGPSAPLPPELLYSDCRFHVV